MSNSTSSAKVKQHKKPGPPKQVFRCDECDYVARDNFNLKVHKAAHEKRKNAKPKQSLVCEVCGIDQKFESYYKVHIAACRKRGKPFQAVKEEWAAAREEKEEKRAAKAERKAAKEEWKASQAERRMTGAIRAEAAVKMTRGIRPKYDPRYFDKHAGPGRPRANTIRPLNTFICIQCGMWVKKDDGLFHEVECHFKRMAQQEDASNAAEKKRSSNV